MQWLSSLIGTEPTPETAQNLPGVGAGGFAPGAIVEYHSVSQGAWILAQVRARNPDGTYDLDCKAGVPSDKVRAPQQGSTAPATSSSLGGRSAGYEIGSIVEYYSESQKGWIPARVLGYDPRMGYNLDCKPGVPAEKLRPMAPGTAVSLRPESDGGCLQGSLQTILESGKSHEGTAPQTVATFAPPQRLEPTPAAAAPPTGGSLGPPTFGGGLAASVQGASAAPAQDAPAQLVRVSRREGVGASGGSWHFDVNEDALRTLESYGKRPVAVCTVCGPYRTGKSYLLNLLLGRIQTGARQFKVGSTTRACTEGLWMWGAEDSSASRAIDGTALIFMDCEGFGSTDADRTRDAKLMSLCLLISSVFLLNTKGVINESLFNALSLVCNLAEHVEERGMQASKPALMWLLRDFILQLQDPSSGREQSPDEYLEAALHARPLDSANAERSQAAREVRECLLKFFPRRHCCTLVQPVVDEEQLANLADVPYEELRPAFRREFEAMRSQVINLVREQPKTFAGKVVSGADLAAVLRKLVDALNANTALNVSSAWDGVQHSACQALSDELRATAIAELQKVRGGAPLPIPGGRPLPVRDDELNDALRAAQDALKADWDARAVGDDAVRNDYWCSLTEALASEERTLKDHNVAVAETALAAAGAAWSEWLAQEGEAEAGDARSEALGKLIDDGVPMLPAARAVREALNACRMARVRWDGKVSALNAELKHMQDNLASKTAAMEAHAKAIDDDSTVEATRELGRLQGQIDALQAQAREWVKKEKMLQVQVLEAEDATRKEQQSQIEVRRKCAEQDQAIQDLEGTVAKLKQAAQEAHAPPPGQTDATEGAERSKQPDRSAQPKCTCNVM